MCGSTAHTIYSKPDAGWITANIGGIWCMILMSNAIIIREQVSRLLESLSDTENPVLLSLCLSLYACTVKQAFRY